MADPISTSDPGSDSLPFSPEKESPLESDPEISAPEQRATFLLAFLMLLSIISLSFFHLDKRPPFAPMPKKMVGAILSLDSPVLFALDPLALAEASQQLDRASSITVLPATDWPPEGPILTMNGSHRRFTHAGFELLTENGPWSLWQPRRPSALPLFSLLEVEVDDGEQRIPCPRDHSGAHRCGPQSWSHMGTRSLRIEGKEEQCFWAHPLPNATLRLRFPRVHSPRADQERLRLQTALSDPAIGTGAPVEVRVLVGDDQVLHRHRDRPGWQITTIPDPLDGADLILEISADDPRRRHLCFRFLYQ